MIISACDPGKDNFASSFLDVSLVKGRIKYKLLHSKMVQNTVVDLTTEAFKQVEVFAREMSADYRKYKPQTIIAERFMNRGSMRGASGEIVSLMLGRMMAFRIDMTVIPAASWKNAFNRVQVLDELYEISPFVPHIVDSICIGLYHGCKQLNVKPYEFLADDREYKSLIKNMERLHGSLSRAEAKAKTQVKGH